MYHIIIHRRFYEMFGCIYDIPFAEITTLIFGDLLQFSSVRLCLVFIAFDNSLGNIFSL